MTGDFLADTSAWARFADPGVPKERRAALIAALRERRIWVSGVLRLEMGFSARNAHAYARIGRELDGCAEAAIDPAVIGRALDLQAQLVRTGHHRVPPADLVTIAAAEANGLAVLHYDKDFDVVSEHTDCAAATEWLAPRGSL